MTRGGRWDSSLTLRMTVGDQSGTISINSMKYITFAVPCYNSQDYMRHCIDSLLIGGEDVEIVIVNDGSKDDTLKIAREYEGKYPSVVRVVDKENGGHGSGVNAGLALATGLYYKVVDSDDWVDGEAYERLLSTVKRHAEEGCSPDLYVVNYVYEHSADNTRHFCRYGKKLPTGRIFSWKEVKRFRFSLMLLMHALVYKTSVLRESRLCLPEHTFYVDDIVSYQPLPHTKTLFYLDADLYRYFIGRADQSVNLPNMLKRYGQMLRVMQCLTDAWRYDQIMALPKGLRRYMLHALSDYMLTTMLFVLGERSKERVLAMKALWRHIRETDRKLYRKLRFRSTVTVARLFPGRLQSAVLRTSYRILCRRIKLG